MRIKVLFAASDADWQAYRTSLRTALDDAGLDATLARDLPPDEVDYIVYAPSGGLRDFTPYTRCRAVMSLWAGVETIVGNETLTMPLTRMVDPGLTEGMVEWVTGHVLRLHLNIDHALARQDGRWDRHVPPLARDRPVTILGLGELGHACAKALSALNFPVSGWSRSAKDIPDVRTYAGPEGLRAALSSAEILILLLPDTPETVDILDATALAMLPQGAMVINPGRGTLIDDVALLDALDRDHVAQATLDVFRIEPLPVEHPFWAHPKVTVTPHIASETRPVSAARVIAENMRNCEMGLPLEHLVDRGKGY